MKSNMGTIDRAVRLLFAAVVGALFFTGVISGVVGAVLGALAVVFAATSAIGFCPLYVPLRLSTKRKEATSKTTS